MDQTASSKIYRKDESQNVQKCRDIYGINGWGREYFEISERGHVVINAPTSAGKKRVDLVEAIEGLKQRGIEMPVMLRLENIVHDRIRLLNEAFQRALKECDYGGQYRGVFPIKVNQQKHVIAEIAAAGAQFGHGFEAGSKAELLIALANAVPGSLTICNGYKDEGFIDLGLHATRLGIKCFFVLERVEELELILQQSKHWGIEPLLGVRLKLSTRVEGHWSEDSGDLSLFGLSTRQLMDVVDRLKSRDKLHCLQLLHFHQGSQIPNIRNVRDGVSEACRYYIDLVKEGAAMGYFNLGGGLAVDYTGQNENSANSRNYDLNEYCVDVVEAITASLDPCQIAHPVIISESGRWTVAPMSVLLFNILAVSTFDPDPLPGTLPANLSEPVQNLFYSYNHIDERRLQEHYNDAIYYRDQMRTLFRVGKIRLRERALGENICLAILNQISQLICENPRVHKSMKDVGHKLTDVYYGNFSVFQSLPDSWAIQQEFPVMPLQRLDELPTRNGIIADLTCDCDGKLHKFVGQQETMSALPLHELQPGEDYFIGVFLVGAYQETLGDLHNLFGDTNVANVRITSDGKLEFVQEIKGDSIADVLTYMEYQPESLYQQFREVAELAVRENRICPAQRKQMLNLYSDSLRGYTYFENE